MAITSTINVDGIAGTVVCNIYLNGSILIDTLTYSNSPKQVICSLRNTTVTLSAADFLTTLSIYTSFNNGIIASIFAPKQSVFTPFTTIHIAQTNDGINQLTWVGKQVANVVWSWAATYPSGTIIVQPRTVAITLSYSEWLYCLIDIAGFRDFVLNAYNL